MSSEEASQSTQLAEQAREIDWPVPLFGSPERHGLRAAGYEISPGDIIAHTGGDDLEFLLALKVENEGIVYYSTVEEDYGYYQEKFLAEDIHGVGHGGDGVIEVFHRAGCSAAEFPVSDAGAERMGDGHSSHPETEGTTENT